MLSTRLFSARRLFVRPDFYPARFFSTVNMTKQPQFFDLTSDTATEPTDDMFDMMKLAHRGDDVFNASTSVNDLEKYVAKLLGKEAALFCATGCMTNQLALRVLLTQPPHSVLCDARAHVFVYECGGISYHSQASVSPVMPRNGHHLTLEDVMDNVITDTLASAPTRVISLENTLNGTLMPVEEMKRIHDFARQNDLKLHLDGARLWNASQETGIPMHEYGQYFDTISVCLSKGVGAPIGSIMASTQENIVRARHIRKLMGGGWRQAGFLAVAAKHCIDTVVPTMKQTHNMTKQLATALQELGMNLSTPCETNMIFLDTANAGITVDDLAKALKQHDILIGSGPGTKTRIVMHYQITQQAVDTFIQVASDVVEKRKADPKPIVVDALNSSSIYNTSV
ncbi:pyridoxal phosphate-dependent transferase [Gilbertella persicaria]|uniref:Threonine aldolase n=1 Tax=Rhizopus stolonifer TaxID=4846 RepID=A0A367J9A6_RHIST|nr:pyridoxal phosphate-dependent transferase [Gilbertella persicaria]KAI8095115.1 pyridoxal phosphate-dependent transferase [Gilbertella persicaria]RCH86496.1 Threonine aldolase [Rhizopus stolonifer]